jgi:hypothetical protein
MLRPRDPRVVPAAAHSRRHASVKQWVDKMQAFWNWKLFLLVGASLVAIRHDCVAMGRTWSPVLKEPRFVRDSGLSSSWPTIRWRGPGHRADDVVYHGASTLLELLHRGLRLGIKDSVDRESKIRSTSQRPLQTSNDVARGAWTGRWLA